MNKSHFFVLILLAMLSSCGAAKWPGDAFVKKYNYQPLEIMDVHLSSPKIEGEEESGSGEFVATEELPMYPNGEGGFISDIQNNIRYPESARMAGIQGRVIVEFVIETDGYVREVTVLNSVHPELDAEAVRIVKEFQRFIPAQADGNAVPVRFSLPIEFRLE